jgi:hypothetical protein
MNKRNLKNSVREAWWYLSIIPALGRLRQTLDFKASLRYMARPYLKTTTKFTEA